jgi:Flp pilus assembly pilin Flp
MRVTTPRTASRLRRDERGFTMIFAVMVLFVATLLVAGAFTAVNGDVKLTRTTTAQDQAYYAAQAGLQAYLYRLNSNASYWEECKTVSKVAVPGATDETYSYETLPSTAAAAKGKSCEAGKAATIIESSNSATGTFRVKATGEAKNGTSPKEKRSIVATFTHPGFLNYVFLSVYEVEDPSTTGATQVNCEKFYTEGRSSYECPAIPFVPGDKLNGPFHTDDSVALCGSTTFGRKGYNDPIEVKGSFYAWPQGFFCSNSPKIYGEKITGEKVSRLEPPSTDYELLESSGATFVGRTVIELEGGQMKVVNAEYPKGLTEAYPSSGVVYVENKEGSTCPKYTPFNGNETYEDDAACGDVYIKGTYSKSLTVGAQNDVIIVGNLTEASTGEASVQPTGTATLGLIAEEFVRVFHPVRCSSRWGCSDTKSHGSVNGSCSYQDQGAGEGPPEEWGLSYFKKGSGWGTLNNPVVDAAILSTKHSWIVDHFLCGNSLGTLHIWGAIAQFWRGRVCCADTLEPGSGYLKDYEYDERLKTNQPPSFLSPTSTGGWKIERETG